MKIEHDEEASRFLAKNDEGKQLGLLEYIRAEGNEVYATHTEVRPQHEGKGIASSLVDALVEYAEKTGATIVPMCPYVLARFRKNPEKYANVMKHRGE